MPYYLNLNRTSADKAHRVRVRSGRTLFACGCVLAVLALVILFVVRSASYATEAKKNLFAAQVAMMALTKHGAVFMEWPRSVSDLKRVTAVGAFRWPEDAEQVLNRIEIRFDCSVEEVGNSAPDSCRCVRVKGPIFLNGYHSKIAALINYCKEARTEPKRTGIIVDDRPRVS